MLCRDCFACGRLEVVEEDHFYFMGLGMARITEKVC